MKPIAVIKRALKMLDYLKEPSQKSHITLKGLGRAIDITFIIGSRLQHMGYTVTFQTSTETVVDEMVTLLTIPS